MDLTGKVIIVTGAGTGLGREMSLEFADRGAKVALSSNMPAEIEAVAAQCSQLGGGAIAVEADVRDMASVESMVQRVINECGPVDVLVNNAGIGPGALAPTSNRRLVSELTVEQWEQMLNVNLIGTIRCTTAVLPSMIERGSGSIICLSSGTVRSPLAGMGPYTTSKSAIEMFVKVAALDLADQGIRVNCIQPGGGVDTALVPPDFPTEMRSQLHHPSVMRKCASWLASDDSHMVTGRSFAAMEWNKERGLVECPCENCRAPVGSAEP
jgi:NAD(P)-dependent dehydrogenase (short-subunit alcohol dehydrogenase family)